MTEVPEKQRQARSADRTWMLRDPLQILRLEPVLLRCSGCDRNPGDAVLRINLERRQRITQQVETTNRHRCVKPAVHLLGLDSRSDQLSRDAEAARGGVAEAEATSVGQQRNVERARNVRCQLEPDAGCEIVDQLSSRAGSGVGEQQLTRWVVAGEM